MDGLKLPHRRAAKTDLDAGRIDDRIDRALSNVDHVAERVVIPGYFEHSRDSSPAAQNDGQNGAVALNGDELLRLTTPASGTGANPQVQALHPIRDMANTPDLLDPILLGDLHLPNRILMAPLTRLRGTADHIPTPIMAEYYAQRASAGLIISEGTPVDAMGVGYANVPGIWSKEQTEAWKPVTRAVHDAGGRIFAQIWHVGRISDPSFLNGELPVGPSAIAASGHVSLIRPEKNFVTPRALKLDEIPGIVEAFRHGAENAQAAGFDGVEIHGANGYLLDQFLQDGSNLRTDEYGGSLENRARLHLEVADAAISVWGPGRVGMHLAPRADAHGISDTNRAATFGYLAAELGKRKIAFIAAREHLGPDALGPDLKKAFGGVYVANEALDRQSGQQLLNEGKADAIAYGKLFIANPDLPLRFAQETALNTPNPATFYAHGAEGYTDYPALEPQMAGVQAFA